MMQDDFAILIAEDNPQDAELLDRAIRKAGLRGPVRYVVDGHEAVEYLEGHGQYSDRSQFPFPKVILTDLRMPRVSGLELLQWLRNHPDCCVIPTILLSGSGLAEDITKAYRLGANTYFQKPSSFHELVELVRSLKDYWKQSEIPAVAGNY